MRDEHGGFECDACHRSIHASRAERVPDGEGIWFVLCEACPTAAEVAN